MQMLASWAVGLLFSLVLGHVVVDQSVKRMRRRINRLAPKQEEILEGPKLVPAGLTGFLERLFFTIVVAFDMSGAAPAMMTWLVVKMVTHWNRPDKEAYQAAAFTALLGGLLSMLFALLGGLICRAYRSM